MSEMANILIVDDLPEKLLSYQTVLEETGENLISVRSGADALREVLKHDFAVILMDVQMPEMDGFETARLIRQRKRCAHIPIIFLTAFVDEVRTAQGYATGGVDYIATPVVPEILRAKVRVFVELYRMRQRVAHQAEDHARRVAAEEVARRSSYLAEASRTLASSLDYHATLRSLARLAVPMLGDVSLVSVSDQAGRVQHAEFAWIDSDRTQGVPLNEGSRQLQPWLDDIVLEAVESKRSACIRPVEAAAPLVANAAAGASGADAPVDTVLILPLIARARTLGALTLALRPGCRRFEPGDIGLAEEVAGRAAIALDNAMLVRDIQEADRHKNEFLAMLAHELRNPLAPMRNAVELLRMYGPLQKELVWARDLIDRQVTHLVRLVDDLLDVSRITRGKIRLELKPELAETIVASAVETVAPLVEARHHKLEICIPEEPIWVRADVTRLAQVLSNLLTNAAKYTPDGGQIALTVEQHDGTAVFRVQDTGDGIPGEMLGKIFDMFTQVDNSLARSQGGLGIGLTLVRRLVEMHGGSVQAYSSGPGQGSEFVVRLPAHHVPANGVLASSAGA
jgi:signal transduction histidine kinase/FixJ family two-component response regulator